MSYENIVFNEPNLAVLDNRYFYNLDSSNSSLTVKAADGEIVFTYPTDISIGGEVIDLEYDGFHFWSLQKGPIIGADVTIKKWIITDYYLRLREEKIISQDSVNKYDSYAFAIESYNTTYSATVSGNNSYVCLTDYASNLSDGGVVLTLGPNTDGNFEDVTVTGTIDSNKVGLDFYTLYTYEEGDNVTFTTKIWMFNLYNGFELDGGLYEIDANTYDVLEVYGGFEFKDVSSCTISMITGVDHIEDKNMLMYVKSTGLRFIDINNPPFVETIMDFDNLSADSSTVYEVYDLSVCDGTVYRLQKKAMYYGSDYIWDTYNYQLSPLRNFVETISLSIYPTILPATGMNIADVMAIVHDQYGEPAIGKVVLFTDDDPDGFMTAPDRTTDNLGVAVSWYQSGLSIGVVTIVAKATQYD